MNVNDYTSIKVPKVLSERFDTAKKDSQAWDGYRNFSEFCISTIRIAINDYEEELKKRNSQGEKISHDQG